LSAHASFTSSSTSICTVVICWSAVCFGFGYGYGRNWTSVTAPLSATAETRKTSFGRSLVWPTLVAMATKFWLCAEIQSPAGLSKFSPNVYYTYEIGRLFQFVRGFDPDFWLYLSAGRKVPPCIRVMDGAINECSRRTAGHLMKRSGR